MKEKINSIIHNKYFPYIIILLCCIIIFLPYFSRNYMSFSDASYGYGHDTKFIVSNIEAIEKSISENGIPNSILPYSGNNLGYGIGIFYPRLSHYVAGYIYYAIKNFHLSAIVSLKITYFLITFLSSVFMYILIKKMFKTKKAALLGSLFYMTFPYHLADIFVRDSIAEAFMFVFMPIVLLGIYYLFKDKNKKMFYLLFIGGYVGLVNSHLICSVFFTGLLLIFLLFNYKKLFVKENIFCFIKASIIILILISPFIILMLQNKMNGEYAVFQDGFMSTAAVTDANATDIINFISTSSRVDKIYIFLPIIVIVFFIIGLCNNKKILKTENEKGFYYGLCVFVLLAIYLASNLFPWSKAPEFLLYIQFPWRMFTFIAFGLSILASAGINCFDKKSQNKIMIFSILILLITSISLINREVFQNQPVDNINKSVYGMGWNTEYLPIKSLNNKTKIMKRNHNISILSKNTNTKIKTIKNEVPYLKFKVTTDKKVTVELPRYYYLGYKITYKNEKNNIKKLKYTEDKLGLIKVTIPESGTVIVKYTGTTLWIFAKIISLITFIICIIMLFKKNIVRQYKKMIKYKKQKTKIGV